MIVFRLDNKTTFDNLKHWLNKIDQRAWEPTLIFVGNFSDQNRAVSFEEASAYAASVGIPYFEVSAKTGHNVQLPFWAAAALKLRSLVNFVNKLYFLTSSDENRIDTTVQTNLLFTKKRSVKMKIEGTALKIYKENVCLFVCLLSRVE